MLKKIANKIKETTKEKVKQTSQSIQQKKTDLKYGMKNTFIYGNQPLNKAKDVTKHYQQRRIQQKEKLELAGMDMVRVKDLKKGNIYTIVGNITFYNPHVQAGDQVKVLVVKKESSNSKNQKRMSVLLQTLKDSKKYLFHTTDLHFDLLEEGKGIYLTEGTLPDIVKGFHPCPVKDLLEGKTYRLSHFLPSYLLEQGFEPASEVIITKKWKVYAWKDEDTEEWEYGVQFIDKKGKIIVDKEATFASQESFDRTFFQFEIRSVKHPKRCICIPEEYKSLKSSSLYFSK